MEKQLKNVMMKIMITSEEKQKINSILEDIKSKGYKVNTSKLIRYSIKDFIDNLERLSMFIPKQDKNNLIKTTLELEKIMKECELTECTIEVLTSVIKSLELELLKCLQDKVKDDVHGLPYL